MVGNPGIIVLGDLVMKGYVKDKEAAFEAMKASAMLDERGMNSLKKNGYVAYDEDPTFETVAKTMEYAIADAATTCSATGSTSFCQTGMVSSRSEEHTSELQSRQYLVCRL